MALVLEVAEEHAQGVRARPGVVPVRVAAGDEAVHDGGGVQGGGIERDADAIAREELHRARTASGEAAARVARDDGVRGHHGLERGERVGRVLAVLAADDDHEERVLERRVDVRIHLGGERDGRHRAGVIVEESDAEVECGAASVDAATVAGRNEGSVTSRGGACGEQVARRIAARRFIGDKSRPSPRIGANPTFPLDVADTSD